MIRIQILGLSDGLHHVQQKVSALDLGLDSDAFRDIELDVYLDKMGLRLHVKLDVCGTATLTCDRTLELFNQRVSGSYQLLCVSQGSPEMASNSKDEVIVISPDAKYVDLTEVVRDTLLLAVPPKKVAPGAEFLPLKTTFGPSQSEDTTDPRWSALLALKDDS